MKRVLAIGTTALAFAIGASGAQAALSEYTTKAAFDAAIAGFTAAQTVDFEGVASDTLFASGTGTSGLTFDYSIADYSLQVSSTFGTTSGTQYLGLDNPDTAFYLGDSFTIQLNRTVHAVGLYLIAGGDALAGDFVLSVTGGAMSNSGVPDLLLSDGKAFFMGLVENDLGSGFTSATVRGVEAGAAFLAFTADDITSAAAIPEPASLALMLAGLGVLVVLGGRRRLS